MTPEKCGEDCVAVQLIAKDVKTLCKKIDSYHGETKEIYVEIKKTNGEQWGKITELEIAQGKLEERQGTSEKIAAVVGSFFGGIVGAVVSFLYGR